MHPIPDSISVTLPVGVVAEALTFGGVPFQPAIVELRAEVWNGRLLLSANARCGNAADETFRSQSDVEDEPWCPPAPEWFTAEVARMQASVDYDRREAKRADHLAEMSMGQS